MTVASTLETLLLVQEHDIALDRLRHRRATLPARAALELAQADHATRTGDVQRARAERDQVLAEERRLDDEAQSLSARAAEVNTKLYSGTVTSPKELQAMQADIDMLHRHQSDLEDQELEVMERREALDAQVGALEADLARLDEEMARLRAEIAAAEAEIDAEIETEASTRAGHAAAIPDALVRDYEKRRIQNKGAGAARLVGTTCQACHLSIPSTEAERIRRGAGEQVAYCDNCGAILVP